MKREVQKRRAQRMQDQPNAASGSHIKENQTIKRSSTTSRFSWHRASVSNGDNSSPSAGPSNSLRQTLVSTLLPPPSPRLSYASDEYDISLDFGAMFVGGQMVPMGRSSSLGNRRSPTPKPSPKPTSRRNSIDINTSFGAIQVGSQMAPLGRSTSLSSRLRSHSFTLSPTKANDGRLNARVADTKDFRGPTPVVENQTLSSSAAPTVVTGMPPTAWKSTPTPSTPTNILHRPKTAPEPITIVPIRSHSLVSPTPYDPSIDATTLGPPVVSVEPLSPGLPPTPLTPSQRTWFVSPKEQRRRRMVKLAKTFGETIPPQLITVNSESGSSNSATPPLDRHIRRASAISLGEDASDIPRRRILKLTKTFGEDIPPEFLGDYSAQPSLAPVSLPPPPSSWLARHRRLDSPSPHSLSTSRTHKASQSESHSLEVRVTRSIVSSTGAVIRPSLSLRLLPSTSTLRGRISVTQPNRPEPVPEESTQDQIVDKPASSDDDYFSASTCVADGRIDYEKLPSFFDDSDSELELRNSQDSDWEEQDEPDTGRTTPGLVHPFSSKSTSNLTLDCVPLCLLPDRRWTHTPFGEMHVDGDETFGARDTGYDMDQDSKVHDAPQYPGSSPSLLRHPRVVDLSSEDGWVCEGGNKRKERRQGWSGEWNQPRIQDVIDKLRTIK